MSSTPDHHYQLDPGYRIELFSEQRSVGASDVIELWTREGGLSPAEAQRRVGEVLFVASSLRGQLAGICTTYLARNEQLRTELWHFRTFVAAAHRKSNIAVSLALAGRDRLQDRFASGADGRAIGIIFEVENRGLQSAFPEARWMPTDYQFIGENSRGAHVRVHYFRGASAPEP